MNDLVTCVDKNLSSHSTLSKRSAEQPRRTQRSQEHDRFLALSNQLFTFKVESFYL